MTDRSIVALADVHLHYAKAFATGHRAQNSRFLQTCKVLQDSLAAAAAHGAVWVCAGDWVHTIGWVHNEVLTHLIQLLNKWPGVEKVTVWGNHDSRSRGGRIAAEETVVDVLRRSVHNLHVLDQDNTYTAANGLRMYGAGYQPDRTFISLPAAGLYDVGVFHQTVQGTTLPGSPPFGEGPSTLDPADLYAAFPLSIVGDIHHPQLLVHQDRSILVPGSPEHHNFGDRGEHGWWICTLPDNVPPSCVMTPSASPEFRTVETAAEVRPDGHYYRVRQACTAAELPPNAQVIAPPPITVTERSTAWDSTDPRQVLAAWVNAAPPPPGEEETYLATAVQWLEEYGLVCARAIRPLRLLIRHFQCIAEAEVVFPHQITMVTGASRYFTSNGAGKTTIFEALFWALFGSTTKGVSAEEVIQWGEDGCAVAVELLDTATQQTIKVLRSRSRKGTTQLQVEVGGEEWNAASTAQLTRDLTAFLGITPNLYQALAYYSQSKLLLFSQATDAERKEMLSDLCGLGTYQAAAAAARAFAATEATHVATLKARREEIQRQAAIHQQHVVEVTEEVARAEETRAGWALLCKEEEQAVDRQRNTLRKDLEEHLLRLARDHEEEVALLAGTYSSAAVEQTIQEQQAKATEAYQATYARYAPVYESLRAQYVATVATGSGGEGEEDERIALWLKEQKEASARYANGLRNQLHDYQGQARVHSATLTQAQTHLVRLEALPAQCPVCLQPLAAEVHAQYCTDAARDVAAAQQLLRMAEEQVEEKSAELLRYEAVVQRFTEAWDQLTALRAATVSYRTVLANLGQQAEQQRRQQAERYAQQVHASKTRLQNASEMARSRAEEAERGLQVRLQHLAARDAEHQATIARLQSILYRAQEALAACAAGMTALTDTIASRRRGQAMGEYWSTGLGRGGVQGLLLDGIAYRFNMLQGQVLPLLTRGVYDVQFATTSTVQDGGTRERTAFVIREHTATVSYEALSGGQRRRIDLGIMLTLALAVAQAYQIPGVLGLLILDEVTAGLDTDGVEALYEVLQEVQQTIPSIFLITHDPDLQALFQHTMTIVQDATGSSRITTNRAEAAVE